MTLFHDQDSLNCSCRITAKSRRAMHVAIIVTMIKYKVIFGHVPAMYPILCSLNILTCIYSYWIKVLMNKFVHAYDFVYLLIKEF